MKTVADGQEPVDVVPVVVDPVQVEVAVVVVPVEVRDVLLAVEHGHRAVNSVLRAIVSTAG